MRQIVVSVKQVRKKYMIHHQKPTLVESFFKKKEEFWALSGINLKVKKGENVGLIGVNGAGKSTLMKVITGITTPTTGEIVVKGRVASLIDLEAGFEPDLTGEENIVINGLLLGMSNEEIRNVFNDIVDFSGIGRFIDAPLYTYSSGMKLRLGFSVAVYSNPDILIVDEVITAGDEDFRAKAYQRIREYFGKDKTVILTSHDLRSVEELCDESVWIDKGKVRAKGETKKIINDYLNHFKSPR